MFVYGYRASCTSNALQNKQEKYLLSDFVVKRDDTFVFSFLRAWLKLCVLVGPIVLFLIFHVVHVSFGSTASDNS